MAGFKWEDLAGFVGIRSFRRKLFGGAAAAAVLAGIPLAVGKTLRLAMRIPTKPARSSDLKPATRTDLKPATVPK